LVSHSQYHPNHHNLKLNTIADATNMVSNASRHHLPLNSMLFKSTPNLRDPAPLPTNPTLVNLHDAADTGVTALPMQPVGQPKERKPTVWKRAVAKAKKLFGRKKKLQIGGPTNFQHHSTGGMQPLRRASA
jgi:hypothetical protein